MYIYIYNVGKEEEGEKRDSWFFFFFFFLLLFKASEKKKKEFFFFVLDSTKTADFDYFDLEKKIEMNIIGFQFDEENKSIKSIQSGNPGQGNC